MHHKVLNVHYKVQIVHYKCAYFKCALKKLNYASELMNLCIIIQLYMHQVFYNTSYLYECALKITECALE